MKFLVILSAFLLISTTLADNMVVTGVSEAAVRPDMFTLQWTVQTSSDSPSESFTSLQTILNELVVRYRELGIPSQNLTQVDFSLFNSSMNQDKSQFLGIPTTQTQEFVQGASGNISVSTMNTTDVDGKFISKTRINVVSGDASNLGELIQASIEVSNGTAELTNIIFDVSPMKESETEKDITQFAVQDAKEKALLALTPLGMQINGVNFVGMPKKMVQLPKFEADEFKVLQTQLLRLNALSEITQSDINTLIVQGGVQKTKVELFVNFSTTKSENFDQMFSMDVSRNVTPDDAEFLLLSPKVPGFNQTVTDVPEQLPVTVSANVSEAETNVTDGNATEENVTESNETDGANATEVNQTEGDNQTQENETGNV